MKSRPLGPFFLLLLLLLSAGLTCRADAPAAPTEAETLAWLNTHLPDFAILDPSGGKGSLLQIGIEDNRLVLVCDYDPQSDADVTGFTGTLYPQAKVTIELNGLAAVRTNEVHRKTKRVATAVTFDSPPGRQVLTLASQRLELGKFADDGMQRAILNGDQPTDAATATKLAAMDANGIWTWLAGSEPAGTPAGRYVMLFRDAEWAKRFANAATRLVELHGGFVRPAPSDNLFK